MKIVSNLYSWLFSFLITSYIFLWDLEFSKIGINVIDYNLRYIILILLIPIGFKEFKVVKNLNFNLKIYFINFYKKNKFFLYFFIFVFFHLIIVNYLNDIPLRFYNIQGFVFLCLIGTIYINYRDKIIQNLDKIVLLFVYILIISFVSSFFLERQELFGSCFEKYYIKIYNFIYFNFLYNYNFEFKLELIKNILFQENSHLAMVLIGVFFYLLCRGYNKLYFLFISLIIFFISAFYLSTTYMLGLIVCASTLSIYYFYKRENYIKLVIYNILVIIVSSWILFTDYSCSKKIESINLKTVYEKNYWKKEYDEKLNCALDTTWSAENCDYEEQKKSTGKNSTSIIYERSISTNISTLKKSFLGWGLNNNDMATIDWLNDHQFLENVGKIDGLNYKDALGNLFKLFNEFGIFTFLLFYNFLLYIFQKEKIKPYKVFFISIFIIQLFRAAGYFNGGFLFVIFELVFFKKFVKN